MKKWLLAIILCLTVCACACVAFAEPEPENSFTLEPLFNPDEPVPLWNSVAFAIRSDTIRNDTVLFFYNEGAEPAYIWIDEGGYGEAWFTPGTTKSIWSIPIPHMPRPGKTRNREPPTE